MSETVQSRGTLARVLIWSAVAAATAVFYVLAWHGRPVLDDDSASYLRVAADLSDLRLEQLYARPVGYPLLLAATGSVPEPGLLLLVVQILLHVAAVIVLAETLRRLGLPPLAVAAFAFAALLPPFVEPAGFVLSETLTQLLLIAGVVGLVRFTLDARLASLVLSACAVACVGLVHAAYAAVSLPLAVVTTAVARFARVDTALLRRALVGGLILVGSAGCLLGAVVVHNQARFGYAVLSPVLGFTLSHKTVRFVERLPPEFDDLRPILIRHRDAALVDPEGDHLAYGYIFRAVPDLEAATGLRGPALSARLVRANLALIRLASKEYVDEVLRSLVWYGSPGVTAVGGLGSGLLRAAGRLLRVVVLLSFAGVVVLVAGPCLLLRRGSRAGAPANALAGNEIFSKLLLLCVSLGVIGYSAAVNTLLTAAVFRLRVPVDLLILACIPVGISLFADLRSQLQTIEETVTGTWKSQA